MAVYINNWEHYSNAYTSAEEFGDVFFTVQNETIGSDKVRPLDEPPDLYDYIEKRGSGKKSNFTKVTSYISKKLSKFDIPDYRMGIIMATEFGNIIDMCNLANLAHSSPSPISAQIFPNATISSATVTASIVLQAKGLNLTINSGVLSFYYALMIAKSYIEDDKLDACIVMVGDDYNQFAMEDINTSYMEFEHFLSTINGVMLSKYKNEFSNNYIIKNVAISSEDSIEAFLVSNTLYSCYKPCSRQLVESALSYPCSYIGPSIAFAEIMQCLKHLKESTTSQECRVLLSDNGLVASLDIEKETS
ncbi:MAG: hypothetical protein N3I35_16525 [Clostridia bacterium]|nr:hypothetical protein [Clostridia bacterium]